MTSQAARAGGGNIGADARPERLAPAAHAFVATIFSLLGLSFIASTAQLYLEYRDLDWRTLIAAHSHIFFFFPVFGIVALAAYYIPAVVFTDFYWRGRDKPLAIRFGPLRYSIGTVAVIAAAAWFTYDLGSKSLRGIWEVAPAALMEDRVAPVPDCVDEAGRPCLRQPVLATLQRLRAAALDRKTITEFARPCKPDLLMEPPPYLTAARHCFPANARMSASACCKVQAQFASHVAALHLNERTRSDTSRTETLLTFAKAFFIIVLVVVSALLVLWQQRIQLVYPGRLEQIDRGIIVGSFAMLFWLLMDYGYLQTSYVLFGRDRPGFEVRLSVVVAFWSMLLIIYFLRRVGGSGLNAAQLSTIFASGYAVFQYEQITNISATLLGVGAKPENFVVLGVLAVLAIELVYGRWKLPLPSMRPPRAEQWT
jgi:heme/copper-type cytochrome/quinol oxidase subunit 4